MMHTGRLLHYMGVDLIVYIVSPQKLKFYAINNRIVSIENHVIHLMSLKCPLLMAAEQRAIGERFSV
jgi:hypothetical protein